MGVIAEELRRMLLWIADSIRKVRWVLLSILDSAHATPPQAVRHSGVAWFALNLTYRCPSTQGSVRAEVTLFLYAKGTPKKHAFSEPGGEYGSYPPSRVVYVYDIPAKTVPSHKHKDADMLSFGGPCGSQTYVFVQTLKTEMLTWNFRGALQCLRQLHHLVLHQTPQSFSFVTRKFAKPAVR